MHLYVCFLVLLLQTLLLYNRECVSVPTQSHVMGPPPRTLNSIVCVVKITVLVAVIAAGSMGIVGVCFIVSCAIGVWLWVCTWLTFVVESWGVDLAGLVAAGSEEWVCGCCVLVFG